MSVPTIAPVKGTRTFTVKQPPYKHLEGHLPARCIICGASGQGKGVAMQSLILNVWRDTMARIFLFSPTATTDTTWEPVFKYIRKDLKVPEEEQIAWDDFDVEALDKIIDQQKRIVKFQKDHNQKQLHQILIIVDDFASDESVMRHKKGEALKTLFFTTHNYKIILTIS